MLNCPVRDMITPRTLFFSRRQMLKGMTGLVSTLASAGNIAESKVYSGFDSREIPNTLKQISNYNNYYEFSTNKKAVALLAQDFITQPWELSIDGLVANPLSFSIETLIKSQTLRDYLYRLRCVEGWSMVIPWLGISLGNLIRKAVPKTEAKYVLFESIYRPKEMVGQRRNTLAWPYTEGLRLDEALNPLTILALGVYGKPLPKQNGAPIRLVVPWKYGFKSIKALSKITLVSDQPVTSWMKASPAEYGFYANVNPKVAHPRWSQRRELRIGEQKKRKTLMFNGYEEQVAHLYQGMDLNAHF